MAGVVVQSWLYKARVASDFTCDECAALLQLTAKEFAELEEHPGQLTINELRVLHNAFNAQSQLIVENALSDSLH